MAMMNNRTGPNSLMAVDIRVGHEASHRSVPHPQGFTHDWMAYVDPIDDTKLEHFVEKVVFTLHETFEHPVQEMTKPPYHIHESGYASFGLKIDIIFRSPVNPKERLIHYEYDLFLPGEGQPCVRNFKTNRVNFGNPSPAFRAMLLAGGAKETLPEALAEMARQQRIAAGLGGGDNSLTRQTSYTTDEERRDKKKKDKEKKKRERKEKDWSRDSSDKTSPPYGLTKDDRTSTHKPGGTISDSSSSSSSPINSPSMVSSIQVDQAPNNKGSLSASDSSSSSDSDSDDNTSQHNNNHKRSSTSPTTKTKKSRHSNDNKPQKKRESSRGGMMKKAPNGVALDILLDLHEKMKATTDGDLLQRFVDVIETESTQFKITDHSFDFDLCTLDAVVIHKLEAIFK